MFKILKNRKNTKKLWLLVGILVLPAFLFFGLVQIPTKKEARTRKYIGEINGKKILFEEFKNAIEATKNLIIVQLQTPEKDLFIRSLELQDQSWKRLILLKEAQRRRIKVDDQEVIAFIKNIGFFKNKRNEFDQDTYLRILRYSLRTLPRDFEEQIRQGLMISKLYSEITKDIDATEEEIKEEFRKLNEEYTIEMVGVFFSDLYNQITPTEEELKEYFSKHKLSFKIPLTFNLEYLIFDDLEEANNIIKKSEKNDFKEVIKESKLEIKETGNFTETEGIPGLGWIEQIFEELKKAEEGKILSPVKIDQRYYLFRVKTKKEPHIPDFENVQNKVREAFIAEKAKDLAKEKIESVYKRIKEAKEKVNLEQISLEFNLNYYKKLGPFKYGGYLEKIGSTNEFCQEIKDLKEGEISNFIYTSRGIFLARLITRTVFDETKFNQEKETIRKQIAFRKKENSFNEFLKELEKKAKLY